MVRVQIRAQSLRSRQLVASTNALAAFETMPEVPEPSSEAKPPSAARWRQSDVKRVIAAAEGAGLASYRIEIAPDGTIAIIVGMPADTEADSGSHDGLRGS